MALVISNRFFTPDLFSSFVQLKDKMTQLFVDLTQIHLPDHEGFFMGMGASIHFEAIGDLDPLIRSIAKRVDEMALSQDVFGSAIHMEYKTELKFLRTLFFKKQFLGSIGYCLAQAVTADYKHLIEPILAYISEDELAIKEAVIVSISKRNYELTERLLLLVDHPMPILEDQLVYSVTEEDEILFEFLLKRGVDPRCKGGVCLKYAVTTCQHEIIKKLIKFDWSTQPILEETIEIAIYNQDLVSLLLLEKVGLIPNSKKSELLKIVTKGKNIVSWLKEREIKA